MYVLYLYIVYESKRAPSTGIIHTSSSPFKVSEANLQDDSSDYPNYELLDFIKLSY